MISMFLVIIGILILTFVVGYSIAQFKSRGYEITPEEFKKAEKLPDNKKTLDKPLV